MAKYELKLPNMGESVAEATLTSWLKKVGDVVLVDDAVVEVATDKVDSEVITEYSGTLLSQNFKEGDVVKVGETIAVIETAEAVYETTPEIVVDEPEKELEPQFLEKEIEEVVIDEKVASNQIEQAIERVEQSRAPIDVSNATRFYSPLVKNIAEAEGVSFEELETIKGTGSEGRVTKSDILDYVADRKSGKIIEEIQAIDSNIVFEKKEDVVIEPVKQIVDSRLFVEKEPDVKPVAPSLNGQNEIIEMDRMRKIIATHMRESVETSVHVQSFMEADVTDIWSWRTNVKDSFQKREGENLTFTPVFLMAIAKALRDFPMMNISVDGEKIIKKHNINIGMATALPTGNLIVPVIKNADQLSLSGMVKAVNDFAKRAKANQLKPDDVMGGTFTVSNIGSFGSLFGTPIINQPQVGIIALGAIRKVPAVVETEEGDYIGIRHKMFITHAYDHRVVDGALGGLFLKRVVDYLEDWNDKKNCF
ncbi:MAG: 2-oxo acid dehydrogenase subunit E2 [Flavobacteriales bacterium]|nr:2-oxo acid dehydrogenase subunit E2 [Flavobacteriales bacterium]